MWLFTAVQSNMCWSKLLKTPLSTQTGSTFIEITFEIPALWGKAPPIEFNHSHYALLGFFADQVRVTAVFVVFNTAKHFILSQLRRIIPSDLGSSCMSKNTSVQDCRHS